MPPHIVILPHVDIEGCGPDIFGPVCSIPKRQSTETQNVDVMHQIGANGILHFISQLCTITTVPTALQELCEHSTTTEKPANKILLVRRDGSISRVSCTVVGRQLRRDRDFGARCRNPAGSFSWMDKKTIYRHRSISTRYLHDTTNWPYSVQPRCTVPPYPQVYNARVLTVWYTFFVFSWSPNGRLETVESLTDEIGHGYEGIYVLIYFEFPLSDDGATLPWLRKHEDWRIIYGVGE